MGGNQPYYIVPYHENPGHIKHTYFNPTEVDSEGNKGAVYSTMPDNEAQGDYSYAYAEMLNRDIGVCKKENAQVRYASTIFLHK